MSQHIIHKQKVNIQTNISTDAFALQNRVSSVLKNDVTNKLEALFNQVSPNGKILRIDKLELNLGTINKQNLESEFSQKLLEQLSNALSDFEIKNGDTKFTEIENNKSLIDS
ncbi:MAG: contractile injection system tape measure protein, partial [Ferruginibacter sp.]